MNVLPLHMQNATTERFDVHASGYMLKASSEPGVCLSATVLASQRSACALIALNVSSSMHAPRKLLRRQWRPDAARAGAPAARAAFLDSWPRDHLRSRSLQRSRPPARAQRASHVNKEDGGDGPEKKKKKKKNTENVFFALSRLP